MKGSRLAMVATLLVLGLAACGRPGPAPSPSPEISLDDALARVRQQIPASRYVTNDLLPTDAAAPMVTGAQPVKLRVGMPWVLNDEIAPWFVGLEKGYYHDAGLELELVPGGPNVDPLQLLAASRIDIAVPPAGFGLVELIASPTSADLVAIGTVLKGSPYCWLGIDANTPRDQPSTRKLQPSDFVNKTIGMQPGSDAILHFLLQEYRLPPESLHVRRAGFTPEPLLAGSVDFYAALIVNQPRILEQAGYKNWIAFRFSDWGWEDFSDVSIVRRDALASRADVWRRYLWATGQALRFILDHPDEAAEITARRSTDVPLTPAMVRRRFDLQRDLAFGAPGSPLQQMPPEQWDRLAARLLQSGAIQLPEARSAPKTP